MSSHINVIKDRVVLNGDSDSSKAVAATAATTENGGGRNSSSNSSAGIIKEPTDLDVLFGRGVGTNRHVGNEKFRTLVHDQKEMYVSSTKKQKMDISVNVVNQIRKDGGRFLERKTVATTARSNYPEYYFEDVGDKKAIEKTSQALRDAAAPLRKKLVESGVLSAVNNNYAKKKNQNKRKHEMEQQQQQQQQPQRPGHRKVHSSPVDLVSAHQEQRQQNQFDDNEFDYEATRRQNPQIQEMYQSSLEQQHKEQYDSGAVSSKHDAYRQQQEEEMKLPGNVVEAMKSSDPIMNPLTFMPYEQRRRERRRTNHHRRIQSEDIRSSSSSASSSATDSTGRRVRDMVNDATFLSAVFEEMDSEELVDDAIVFNFDSKEEMILKNSDAADSSGGEGSGRGGGISSTSVNDNTPMEGIAPDPPEGVLQPPPSLTSSSYVPHQYVDNHQRNTRDSRSRNRHRRIVSTPFSFNSNDNDSANDFLGIINEQSSAMETRNAEFQQQAVNENNRRRGHRRSVSTPLSNHDYIGGDNFLNVIHRQNDTIDDFDAAAPWVPPPTTEHQAIQHQPLRPPQILSNDYPHFQPAHPPPQQVPYHHEYQQQPPPLPVNDNMTISNTSGNSFLQNNVDELCSTLFDNNNAHSNHSSNSFHLQPLPNMRQTSGTSSTMSFDDEPLPM